MKKIFASLLAASLLAFTFTGCEGSSKKEDDDRHSDKDRTSSYSSSSKVTNNSGSSEEMSDSSSNEESSSSSTEKKPSITDIFDFPKKEPVVFTQDDIEEIHNCILNLPHSDTPFDFSKKDIRINDIVGVGFNWYNRIFSDIHADDSVDGFTGTSYFYNPNSVEAAIREYILPEFNISDYDYRTAESWNDEHQMFKLKFSIEEGYVNRYEIIEEEQKDDYYYITVLNLENWSSEYDFIFSEENIQVYMQSPRQQYVFRKLPNGKIAPYKMTEVKISEREKELYRKMTCYQKVKENKRVSDTSYYIFDFDKDGKKDLVELYSINYNLHIDYTTKVYSNFDLNKCTEYSGELKLQKDTGNIILHEEFNQQVGGNYSSDKYTDLSTGNVYFSYDSSSMVTESLTTHESYFEINGVEVSQSEYDKAMKKAGIYDLEDYPLDGKKMVEKEGYFLTMSEVLGFFKSVC